MNNTWADKTAEVLRYFLDGKARDLTTNSLSLYQDLVAMNDDQRFCDEVRARWPQDDDNAVVGWTVGTRRFNRSAEVSAWNEAEVEIGTIYSKGIDDAVKCMLDVVGGNLKDLARMIGPHAEWASRHRFHFDREPDADFYMIGVRHGGSEYNGTVELLDGSHRLIAMAVQGRTTVKAYIANLK